MSRMGSNARQLSHPAPSSADEPGTGELMDEADGTAAGEARPGTDAGSPRPPRGGRRISSILEALPHAVEGERISFGDLVDLFEGRAYGPLIVLFAAPNVLPVALPGISAILGIPLLLLTGQLMLGIKRPWLPPFLRRRSIARETFELLVGRIVPRLRRIEARVSPRLLRLTGHAGKRAIGALGLILAFIIMLPVPFGNAVPGLALVVMSVGLLGRDGMAVMAGGLIGMAGLAIASGFIYGALLAALALLRGGLGV